MSKPPKGTDEYKVWYEIHALKHLQSYLEEPSPIDDPDLHEDLREAHPDVALAALDSLLTKAKQLQDALDVLRWKNDDGTYEENCWCDVKSTDYPNMHMPRCEAAREALGVRDPGTTLDDLFVPTPPAGYLRVYHVGERTDDADHEHEWVSARNEAVTSGVMCRICMALAPEPEGWE